MRLKCGCIAYYPTAEGWDYCALPFDQHDDGSCHKNYCERCCEELGFVVHGRGPLPNAMWTEAIEYGWRTCLCCVDKWGPHADAEEADFLRRAGVAEEHLPREEESE